MTSSPRIVIVGAGIIGCATARELAVRGAACTVLDPRRVAGGATQASAGMLAPYVEAHEAGPLLELSIRSLELYDEWIAAVTREAEGTIEYRRTGTLEVALDPDHAADLKRSAAALPSHSTWLEAADARRAHPALGSVAGALFTPTHGNVSAAQLAGALARAAQRQGAAFRRAAVERITTSETTLRLSTTEGEMDADIVVLAAGAWTNRIEGIATPPVRPVRGQLLHLGWHGHPLSSIVWGPECYVVPRVDGTILVGATAEEVGFDERTTAAGIRDLLDAVCELLPEGWGSTFLQARAGLRPATPDGLPVLGPDAAVPGLVHASGHYRNGILLAPITARLIADWILEGTRDRALESFRADRF